MSVLSRYFNDPTEADWIAAKRVLRYLKGTANYGLHLGNTDEFKVEGFTDADYEGDRTERKSTSAYVFQIGKESTVSWACNKQNTVALSTTESEYMVAAKALCEGIWIRNLLEEIDRNSSAEHIT